MIIERFEICLHRIGTNLCIMLGQIIESICFVFMDDHHHHLINNAYYYPCPLGKKVCSDKKKLSTKSFSVLRPSLAKSFSLNLASFGFFYLLPMPFSPPPSSSCSALVYRNGKVSNCQSKLQKFKFKKKIA